MKGLWLQAKEAVLRNGAHMLFGGAQLVDGLTCILSLGFYTYDCVCNAAWDALKDRW